MQLGSLVIAPYGKCPGRPDLKGIGQVVDRVNRAGLTLIKVRPIKCLPFTKWFDAADCKPLTLEDFLAGESPEIEKASA